MVVEEKDGSVQHRCSRCVRLGMICVAEERRRRRPASASEARKAAIKRLGAEARELLIEPKNLTTGVTTAEPTSSNMPTTEPVESMASSSAPGLRDFAQIIVQSPRAMEKFAGTRSEDIAEVLSNLSLSSDPSSDALIARASVQALVALARECDHCGLMAYAMQRAQAIGLPLSCLDLHMTPSPVPTYPACVAELFDSETTPCAMRMIYNGGSQSVFRLNGRYRAAFRNPSLRELPHEFPASVSSMTRNMLGTVHPADRSIILRLLPRVLRQRPDGGRGETPFVEAWARQPVRMCLAPAVGEEVEVPSANEYGTHRVRLRYARCGCHATDASQYSSIVCAQFVPCEKSQASELEGEPAAVGPSSSRAPWEGLPSPRANPSQAVNGAQASFNRSKRSSILPTWVRGKMPKLGRRGETSATLPTHPSIPDPTPHCQSDVNGLALELGLGRAEIGAVSGDEVSSDALEEISSEEVLAMLDDMPWEPLPSLSL